MVLIEASYDSWSEIIIIIKKREYKSKKAIHV